MSADQLLQDLTQATYVLIFVVAALEAAQSRRAAAVDIALYFGAAAVVIAIGWVTSALNIPAAPALAALNASLLMALPYLLLRLVDDFAEVPPALMRGALIGLLLIVITLFALPAPARPLWLNLLLVAYFVGLEVYAAVTFVGAARRARGVTRRRMQAAAAGSLCLGLVIAVAGLQLLLPDLQALWTGLSDALALGSGLAYFVGFAPPAWLRRAWQEPELRAFLTRAARLPRLPDTRSILRELEAGAATSLGAPHAVIGLWDEASGLLRAEVGDRPFTWPADQLIGGRAFTAQRPVFSADAPRDDPAHAELYRGSGAIAVLAAPITAGGQRLGVLSVFAPQAPIFAGDDLILVQLLADQAAVILESRALIDEAARVRAREEATRLKDDFLSAAAHDLKTPLATLLLQAQMLERRARRWPEGESELTRMRAHIQELQRLRALVLELLDAARAEQGQLVGARAPVDLAAIAREVRERRTAASERWRLDLADGIVGEVDRARITQMLDNLYENAVKYSLDDPEIVVRLWREGDQARLTVADAGIGIPAADLPHIFDRFQRGGNVDDRRYAGLGLGLFICRSIVEQHGGRIWATSPGPGQGSAFHVALPALPPRKEARRHDPVGASARRPEAGRARSAAP